MATMLLLYTRMLVLSNGVIKVLLSTRALMTTPSVVIAGDQVCGV